MARWVVLEFDDDVESEAIIANLPSVVGVYKKPTVFCDRQCIKGHMKGTGFFQGRKYGWWVCAVCGKPTRPWGTNHQAVVSQSNNLLETVRQEMEESDGD